MAAYVMVNVEVHDPDAYRDYQRQVRDTLAQFGGRSVMRGGRAETLEGSLAATTGGRAGGSEYRPGHGVACLAGLPGDHPHSPAERDDELPDAGRGRLKGTAVLTLREVRLLRRGRAGWCVRHHGRRR